MHLLFYIKMESPLRRSRMASPLVWKGLSVTSCVDNAITPAPPLLRQAQSLSFLSLSLFLLVWSLFINFLFLSGSVAHSPFSLLALCVVLVVVGVVAAAMIVVL